MCGDIKSIPRGVLHRFSLVLFKQHTYKKKRKGKNTPQWETQAIDLSKLMYYNFKLVIIIDNSYVPMLLSLLSLSPPPWQIFLITISFSTFFSDLSSFTSLLLLQLQSLFLSLQLSCCLPEPQGYFLQLYRIPPLPYPGTLTLRGCWYCLGCLTCI